MYAMNQPQYNLQAFHTIYTQSCTVVSLGSSVGQKVIVKCGSECIWQSPACLLSKPQACVLLREMPTLLGLETVVTGHHGAQPGRSGETTRWRSANIAVNSTSWSPWHQVRVYLKIPDPKVTVHFVESMSIFRLSQHLRILMYSDEERGKEGDSGPGTFQFHPLFPDPLPCFISEWSQQKSLEKSM